jgi:hypothetical protein
MTEEQLKTIILNDKTIKEFYDSLNYYHRLKINRLMYEVFTPTLIKWWHKLRGKKPYLDLNYEPKI